MLNSHVFNCLCFALAVFFLDACSAYGQQSILNIEYKPKLTWSGDLRYRVARGKESIDDERPMQQLRARLGFQADMDESTSLVFRLATGTSAINANQNLGDPTDPGLSRRSFGLDLAFVTWAAAEDLKILAGKTINPFWAPAGESLIFEPTISFEGISIKVETPWSSSKAFLNAGGYIISENYDTNARQDLVDAGIVGMQLGYSQTTSFGTGTVHASSFQFINIQDKEITSIQKDALPDPYSIPYDRYRGNIIYRPDPTLKLYNFQDKFVLRDLGIEWKLDLAPVGVVEYYDAVTNTEADDVNRANEMGIALSWGRLLVSWGKFEKQAESLVGAFTDAYVNGGGTDSKGTRVLLSYRLSKSSQISYTQYAAKRGISTVERDYSNSLLDVDISF